MCNYSTFFHWIIHESDIDAGVSSGVSAGIPSNVSWGAAFLGDFLFAKIRKLFQKFLQGFLQTFIQETLSEIIDWMSLRYYSIFSCIYLEIPLASYQEILWKFSKGFSNSPFMDFPRHLDLLRPLLENSLRFFFIFHRFSQQFLKKLGI